MCVCSGQALPGPPILAVPAPVAAPGPMAPSVEPAAATPYLEVNGMVTPEVLMDDEEYKEVGPFLVPLIHVSQTLGAARRTSIMTAFFTFAGPSAAFHSLFLPSSDDRACRGVKSRFASIVRVPQQSASSTSCIALRHGYCERRR